MRNAVHNCFIICLMTGLLAVLAEGASGWFYGLREMGHVLTARQQVHTKYDPNLGWTNEPGKVYRHYYGENRHLSIDENGFRTTSSTAPSSAPLAICSGDSFTFGFGVGDNSTWCAKLSSTSSGMRTLNMGVGAYGVDQAYLRYLQESPKLKNEIHIFAFINEDFERARSLNYRGLGKPGLNLRAGVLSAANSPVPERQRGIAEVSRYLGALENLSLFRLIHSIQRRIEDTSAPKLEISRSRLVFSRMFQELAAFDQKKGVQTILVFLPRADDFESEPFWREFVTLEAKRWNIHLIDLVPKLRELPAKTVDTFFLPSDRHYTEMGNDWVAQQIANDPVFQQAAQDRKL